ncbi:hypothetical protein B0H16DRAFT_1815286 [Mycena metata]|uniref:Uncharacterized protein n=1 Tax=Mycena metata TaxID=1033252 RepID=A0AAD7J9C5_9AGAR|nr:hypothetical protein B0H16DRAFT_1815286 [Mycena metata]
MEIRIYKGNKQGQSCHRDERRCRSPLSRAAAITRGYWTGDPGDENDVASDPLYGYDGEAPLPPAAAIVNEPLERTEQPVGTGPEREGGILVNDDEELGRARELLGIVEVRQNFRGLIRIILEKALQYSTCLGHTINAVSERELRHLLIMLPGLGEHRVSFVIPHVREVKRGVGDAEFIGTFIFLACVVELYRCNSFKVLNGSPMSVLNPSQHQGPERAGRNWDLFLLAGSSPQMRANITLCSLVPVKEDSIHAVSRWVLLIQAAFSAPSTSTEGADNGGHKVVLGPKPR